MLALCAGPHTVAEQQHRVVIRSVRIQRSLSPAEPHTVAEPQLHSSTAWSSICSVPHPTLAPAHWTAYSCRTAAPQQRVFIHSALVLFSGCVVAFWLFLVVFGCYYYCLVVCCCCWWWWEVVLVVVVVVVIP